MTENHPLNPSKTDRLPTHRRPGLPKAAALHATPDGQAHKQARFYRPGLDALRFFAFSAVFLHHGAEGWGLYGSPADRLVQSLGFGLCLFFTLSAYLITTLLLRERAFTHKISLRLFYERRILRIWPLYFFGLALGVLIDWRIGLFPGNRSFYLGALLMIGNWFAPQPAYMLQLWSISVEEQFYLVWPGVVKRASTLQLRAIGIGLLILSAAITGFFGYQHIDNTMHVWFNSLVQMQMFAAGILLALWQDCRGPVIRSAVARCIVFPIALLTWYAAVRYLHIKDGLARGALAEMSGYLLVAFTCALLVDAMSSAQRVPRPLIVLGRISFGLYVFHSPALLLTRRFFPGWHLHQTLPVAGAATVLAAALSYRYLETPFLKLKAKLEVVKSRPVSAVAV